MLDVSSFQKAFASLKKAVERAEKARQDEELRDAVIQRFKYTYELCWKMLKRRLEIDHPNPAQIDQMSCNQLIREGAERGLIEHIDKCFFIGISETLPLTLTIIKKRSRFILRRSNLLLMPKFF